MAAGPLLPDRGTQRTDDPPARGPAPERPVSVTRWTADAEPEPADDLVAAEEPLQVVLDDEPFSVVMRTPGHDLELVLGLLFVEGLIDDIDDVAGASVAASGLIDGGLASRQGSPGLAKAPGEAQADGDAPDAGEAPAHLPPFPVRALPEAENLVELHLTRPRVGKDRVGWQRNLVASTACGICGAAALDALRDDLPPLPPGPTFPAASLRRLEPALREAQSTFRLTGGLHAAALFDRDGTLLATREDVGRHNAVDKLVGRGLLRRELPFRDRGLMLSGRASFELAHKAVAAGIPLMAAVSAPSSLAVHVAHTFRLTLVGFLRDGHFNVYTGGERILP